MLTRFLIDECGLDVDMVYWNGYIDLSSLGTPDMLRKALDRIPSGWKFSYVCGRCDYDGLVSLYGDLVEFQVRSS